MSATKYILIGPCAELVPMSKLPLKGALADEELALVKDGGVLISNTSIEAVGEYE